MSDLIDRQAVIDAITNYAKYLWDKFHETCNLAGMIETIEGVPSAQRWIPVSEGLPEQYGNYLISIHGEDEPDIGTINPNDKRGWSLCDANGFHWASDKKLIVTAWMPLPEPWKGEEDENK